LDVSFANTGVPHAVQWVNDVGAVDVARLGPQIRYHHDFAPAGTNADFVQVTGPHSITIRTYERGVEDETLACGTGVVASSILGGLLGVLRSPVEALTRSGLLLRVHFDLDGGHAKNVCLEGDAVLVFEGILEVPW
jgi:diaminopimelate epimerase